MLKKYTNIINQIKSSLDSVQDISSISGSGVTKVNTVLNMGDAGNASDKQMIVRVKNDNVNMVKNVKAQVELENVKLSVNKNDLDSSVMTINKEYIIKNIDAQSANDGKFLLSRKRELFIRQDTNFVMNTMLDFKRLKNSTTIW